MYTYLHENGPQRALSIAKHLGKQTQKDVNPDLYALMKKHLLHFNEEQKLWSCYSKGAGTVLGETFITRFWAPSQKSALFSFWL